MSEQTTDENGVSVTLKAGTEFSAPWVVVRGGSIEEATEILHDEEKVKNLLNIAAQAGRAFQAVYNVSKQVGGEVTQVTNQQQPQAAPSYDDYPPGGVPPQRAEVPGPQCKHGAMVKRSGEKNGRAWTGFFCPTPKGTPDQCRPQFGN